MNHNHTPSPPQGMDGWRPLEQIPQLKWKLLGQGPSLMNESDMASLILLIFIRMCQFYPSRDSEDAIVRPLPRAKRLLSEPNTLPHIVQLLLTFDPSLVEKVTKLLNIILQVSVGCVPWSVFLSLPLFLSPSIFLVPSPIFTPSPLPSPPQDNPQLPRMFSTGAFFFILMYTGSNILPIAEFLKYTHMKQSFRPDEVS